MMFRFAMVLQDKAPATLNKYICRLSASVLSESRQGLSAEELSIRIKEAFGLDFTEQEVKLALDKKGKTQITKCNGLYCIGDHYSLEHNSANTYIEDLKVFVSRFIGETECPFDQSQLLNLIIRYLYYCFNSSVENLLSLFCGQAKLDANTRFESSDEETLVLNDFLSWKNNEKDSLVYHIVTTCLEYCMLTVKKDVTLSQNLFKGKRFILDANIIFRMSGINNEERQFVTKSFEKHCRDAGIELFFTSSTLDEVTRVIDSQVDFISSLAGDRFPVNSSLLERLNPANEITDFYKRYYDWCSLPGNTAGDYITFRKYLFDLVSDTLFRLPNLDSGVYSTGPKAQQFSDNVQSLLSFKNANRRRNRVTSRSSAETDITNIFDILKARNVKAGSIWQTNDFMVSADQRLIEWANKEYAGVPIVVLPSVWLSIILRFTGRTNDDYKSFCLFLTQRQHNEPDSGIDSAMLLRNVNSKTNDTAVKEKIIAEIVENKGQYSFSNPDDYDSSVDKAFDTVISALSSNSSAQIEELKATLAKSYQDEMSVVIEQERKGRILAINDSQQSTALILAKKKASNKVRFYRWVNKNKWIGYVLAALVFIICIFFLIADNESIGSWIKTLLPNGKSMDSNSFTVYFSIIWGLLSALLSFVVKILATLIGKLGSSEREGRLSEKYYKQNIEIVEMDNKLAA